MIVEMEDVEGKLQVHSTAIRIFDSVEQMAIYFVKAWKRNRFLDLDVFLKQQTFLAS